MVENNKKVVHNKITSIKNEEGVNGMTKQQKKEVVRVEVVEIIKEIIKDDVLVNDCGADSIMFIEMCLSDKTWGT